MNNNGEKKNYDYGKTWIDKHWKWMGVLLILYFIFVPDWGGSDDRKSRGGFDWNDPEDVEDFIEWTDKQTDK